LAYSRIIGSVQSKQWSALVRACCCVLVLLVLVSGANIARAETSAGTRIDNTAELRLDGSNTLRSNTVSLITAERLDVTLARVGSGSVAITGSGNALPVLLTNAGNGQEAFTVAATVSDASATVRLIAIDVDGDGRFDATRDTVLAGGVTPALAPGASLSLLVVVDAGQGTVTANAVTVTAQAVTGSGAQGTQFAGQGDSGGDAVTGATSARATVSVPLAATGAAPSLVKSQVVTAPDGSARAITDAIITYTLEARLVGPTANVRVADPIPAGTVYVAGSLRLDGAALTDAADGDTGTAGAAGIAVTLGDIAAAGTRTIQFQVRIQ
jgi:uncharacterized repeat protein (TIGR01451 family)